MIFPISLTVVDSRLRISLLNWQERVSLLWKRLLSTQELYTSKPLRRKDRRNGKSLSDGLNYAMISLLIDYPNQRILPLSMMSSIRVPRSINFNIMNRLLQNLVKTTLDHCRFLLNLSNRMKLFLCLHLPHQFLSSQHSSFQFFFCVLLFEYRLTPLIDCR